MSERRTDYVIRYSNYVVEHLGVKLYQNKPTNALAELVANAWDADAENVWIEIHLEGEQSAWTITVGDNGIGMNPDEVQDEYLIIGRKRRIDGATKSSTKGRPLTGRKGIGKLAPFGISSEIDIFTVNNLEVTWLRLNLADMLEEATDPEGQAEYTPATIYAGPLQEMDEAAQEPKVAEFLSRLDESGKESGTLVLMRRPTFSNIGWSKNFGTRLVDRMIPAIAADDFQVAVGGDVLTVENALPGHGHRIPESDWNEETLSDGKKIRSWALVVDLEKHKNTYGEDWTQDNAGVAIYAHNKIAQDRPFFFAIKGKEIYSRYLYGVIQADWVDELSDDVISTDRTSLDWDHPELQQLQAHGIDLIRSWIEAAKEHMKSKQRKLIDEKVEKKVQQVPEKYRDTFSSAEVKEMAETILSISPESSPDKVVDITFSAVAHVPSWRLLDDLVKTVESGSLSDQVFHQIVFDFRFFENTNLAQVIARRLRAMKALSHMIREGAKEVEPGTGTNRESVRSMHDLFRNNPWMIDLSWAAVADELPPQLATQAIEAITEKLTHQYNDEVYEFESWRTGGQKAIDFFLLHVTEFQDVIIIIEIKRANKSLVTSDFRQLEDYMSEVRAELDKHAEREWQIRGILIGGQIGPQLRNFTTANPNPAIDVKTWDDLLDEARKSHQSFLSALAMGLQDDPRLEAYLTDLGLPSGSAAEAD